MTPDPRPHDEAPEEEPVFRADEYDDGTPDARWAGRMSRLGWEEPVWP